MEAGLKRLFVVMPLLFGIGFIAPLITQTMTVWSIDPPMGLSRIAIGLAIGGVWGLIANIRGRWL